MRITSKFPQFIMGSTKSSIIVQKTVAQKGATKVKTKVHFIYRLKKKDILKSIKFHLKMLGCLPFNNENWPKLCKKIPQDIINSIQIGLIFLILILNLVSTFSYYIHEVKTFIDFSESVFWASRSILSLILYSLLIWYKPELVKFFDDLGEIVEIRKYSI